MQPHLFCFGLGYSAARLGQRLMAEGWRVSGTTRSEGRAEKLRKLGFTVHLFSREQPLTNLRAMLDGVQYVLISTPPGAGVTGALDAHRLELALQVPQWRWLGYLSTTGVYGDQDGGWVDETSPLAPTSERGKRRVDAEKRWQEFAKGTGAPLHIFRLPGIYGPGRNALALVRQGNARRIDRPGQVFSRIHVRDLVNVLATSMAKPSPGAIYNVCDDEPAPQHEVIAYAASLLGIDAPPMENFDDAAATMEPMARSFYEESKRVRNDKTKQELGVTLEFPSYREGLAAIHARMKA